MSLVLVCTIVCWMYDCILLVCVCFTSLTHLCTSTTVVLYLRLVHYSSKLQDAFIHWGFQSVCDRECTNDKGPIHSNDAVGASAPDRWQKRSYLVQRNRHLCDFVSGAFRSHSVLLPGEYFRLLMPFAKQSRLARSLTPVHTHWNRSCPHPQPQTMETFFRMKYLE